MTGNAQCADQDWEPIYEQEKGQYRYDGENEATQQLFRKDGMFFHKLREVIESGCCRLCISVSQLCAMRRWVPESAYQSPMSRNRNRG